MHTVIGLFCAFAGGLNLIDPTKILPQAPGDLVTSGVGFLTLCGFSWGYVLGVFMARREAVLLGFAASAVYLAVGAWTFRTGDWRMAAMLAVIGVYGFWALMTYRGRILAS